MKIIDFLYPPFCLHCQDPSPNHLCSRCLNQLDLLESQKRCRFCFATSNAPICDICKTTPLSLNRFAVLFESPCPADSLVKVFTRRNQLYLAEGIAGWFAAKLLELNWPLPNLITIPPQSRLLTWFNPHTPLQLTARSLATLLNCPFIPHPKSLLDQRLLILSLETSTPNHLQSDATPLLSLSPKEIMGLSFLIN